MRLEEMFRVVASAATNTVRTPPSCSFVAAMGPFRTHVLVAGADEHLGLLAASEIDREPVVGDAADVVQMPRGRLNDFDPLGNGEYAGRLRGVAEHGDSHRVEYGCGLFDDGSSGARGAPDWGCLAARRVSPNIPGADR